ncbi:MAG: hypothetical protein U0946_06035, partial [Patescibacteria group bacterium]|nr:hypothetical protein [Patescibacteria group bacterium]
MARTFFRSTYSNSIIKQSPSIRGDSSGDIAAAGRPAPTVLPRTTTSDEGLKSKADLNSNSVVIYQVKPPNPCYFGSPGRREAAGRNPSNQR